MADTVSTITILNTNKRLVMRFMNRSDGTGESNVVKVDKSTYLGPDISTAPAFFMIDKVEFDVAGMEVQISADHTTDTVLMRLKDGIGTYDFSEAGGLSTNGTGDTGDILFSTNGHSAGDTYDITLYMRKHS